MSLNQLSTARRSSASIPVGSIWEKPCLRIGHGGASGHAPANTLPSLELALEMGVDMVEFDVRPCRDALLLLHDDRIIEFEGARELASLCLFSDLRNLASSPDQQIPTLEEALELIKGKALVNIDVKAAGYEDAVVERVCAMDMSGEVLYSSLYPESLLRIRQLDPGARTGLSYPEDRGNASTRPYLVPLVGAIVLLMKLMLPYRILRMMDRARASGVMLYHRVVSRPVVQVVHNAGRAVFTWTIDTPQRMLLMRELGVDGIASNYPDLFAQLT